MLERAICGEVGDEFLARHAEGSQRLADSERRVEWGFQRARGASAEVKQGSFHRHSEVSRGVDVEERGVSDRQPLLPGVAEDLAGGGALAKHSECDGTRTKGVEESQDHPFGDVEVGFSSAGGYAAEAEEVFFGGNVASGKNGDGGVGDPRRVAKDEERSREVDEEVVPVSGEEVLRGEVNPRAEIARLESKGGCVEVAGIDVPPVQGGGWKGRRGREEKRTAAGGGLDHGGGCFA